MRLRDIIHDQFVARFHSGQRPKPAKSEQVQLIESELNTRLPRAYHQFVTRFGAIYTPSILREIADKQIDHIDIQQFLEPSETVEDNRGYWSAGMPDDVIGIACDCMGNMIGFHRQDQTVDDAPVIFFDHEFVEVYEVANSMDEFLSWYLDHLEGRLPSG